MFGATLCSANLDDVALLVGAPAYADSDYTYDVGAVYIYKAQSGSSKVREFFIIIFNMHDNFLNLLP